MKNALRQNLGGWLAAAMVGAALLGCNSVSTRFVTGLSAEEQAKAAEFPLYRETLPKGSYERLGAVEGLSCQITRDDSYEASEDNAIKELRRATFRAGGNAVIEVACEALNLSQSSRRCFRSVVCQGTAIQSTSESSP